jgi:hypothetical protein
MADKSRFDRLQEEVEVGFAWTPQMESRRIGGAHAEHWSSEAVACQQRFVGAVEKRTIDEAFHIRDGFRITCDAFPNGLDQPECGNVIGIAPLPDDHDGLCQRCRSTQASFPPRIALSSEMIISSHTDLRVWRERRKSVPAVPAAHGDAWEGD